MVKKKITRERGKIKFSRAFQEFKKGDVVAIDLEVSRQPSFPKRIQGRTGIVKSSRGHSFIVKIKDLKKEKEFIIEPIHLKKMENTEK